MVGRGGGGEKKMSRLRSIIPLSLQAAGISCIPSYSYALSTDNPQYFVNFREILDLQEYRDRLVKMEQQ